MTRVDKYLKRFEAYQNGALDSKELSTFRDDLEQDLEMQEAWKEYLSMMEAFSDKEAISLRALLDRTYDNKYKRNVNKYSQNLWFRASAAAFVIFAIGVLLYFFCSRDQLMFNMDTKTMMVDRNSISPDTIKIPGNVNDSLVEININEEQQLKKNQIASIYSQEEYQIDPAYVELLKSVYRGEWFELKSPQDSTTIVIGDRLVFDWQTNISDSIYFDVLDRKGNIVYKHSTAIESPWVFAPELSPAIYMFRFATEEEPVWLGVFILAKCRHL